MILKELKLQAEAYLACEIKDAVITVPAYFNQSQKNATKDAAKIAGLNVLRLIHEPTAASLAFSIDKLSAQEKDYLVFDFGGGTFDVSILRISEDANEVIATRGDTHLGGGDLDVKLTDYCLEEFKKQTNIDLTNEKQAKNRIRIQCERAKRLLSVLAETTLNIP